MQNLLRACKLIRLKNAVAAGASDITDAGIIDTQGFEGVAIIVAMGAIVTGAVTSLKVQQGADSALGDAADLEGSSITIADDHDNKLVATDIFKPAKRYLRPIVKRATQNATVDGIFAVLYSPRNQPVSHDSTVVAPEYHATPAEGTA